MDCEKMKKIRVTAVLLAVLLFGGIKVFANTEGVGGTEVVADKGRTIVFYGDSNTYGFDPADMTEGRFPEEQRWTTLLQTAVGKSMDYCIRRVERTQNSRPSSGGRAAFPGH